MNNTEFKKKISTTFGPLSKEHSLARELVKKAEKWDKYEYERYGPPSQEKEKIRRAVPNPPGGCAATTAADRSQQQNSSWMPNDREIFRVTWSYLFAQAGWIFMAYIAMFGFLGLMFLAMYMIAT
tara:strand:- start:751 stop:1125 length:375 start_codon:yes stop_codon:yes gene_type:complete